MWDDGEPPAKRSKWTLRTAFESQKKIQPISTTQLFDLNDYCLDEMFGYLDVIDLCSVARVSKRFRQLAAMLFKRKYAKFDFTTLFADRLIVKREARDVLCSFGAMMQSVTIPRQLFQNHDTVGHVEEGLLKDIVKCCGKNLHILILKNFHFTTNVVNALNMFSKSLAFLSLLACVSVSNCVFYLPNLSSLRSLTVTNIHNCYALTDVFPALKYLVLDNVTIRSSLMLEQFIVAHRQLQTLMVINCKGISSDVFRSIAKYMVNLDDLRFAVDLQHESESIEQIQNNILHLGELKNLQYFAWYSHFLSIGNLFAKFVTNKIAMKALYFGDGPLDDQTINAIKKMKTLEILGLHRTKGLKNEHLIKIAREMTQLKELSIQWHRKIEPPFDVLKDVLFHTKHLMELRIHSGKRYPLTTKLYNEILDIVRKRGNGIKLTIKIYIDSADVQDLIPQQTIQMNKNWVAVEREQFDEYN